MKTLPSHIYHFSGTKKGPTVVIFGATHGNEIVGANIIEQLKKTLPKEEIFGEIYLIIGNPDALQKKVRFIDFDLNRLFGDDFEKLSAKNYYSLSIEERRALELAPILAKADYLMDIHSTIKKSIPFVYIKNSLKHIMIAKIFGTKFVVSSLFYCKAKSLHSSVDNFVDKAGGIGITYETGWHKDTSVFGETMSKVKQFLSFVGSAFHTFPGVSKTRGPKHILIYKEILPKKKQFTFQQDYRNLDFLKKGTQLATDGTKKIIVTQDSYIVFPKTDIRMGRTACYLAKEILTHNNIHHD
ncbi:MAG: succinylglutamate desuccinylase/aspartoacylase family protein [Candidatus Peregrinibacteria bacterium]|nr:succinylglutamate desuccinylase/aspartoacylase family protein [Candidatus Peregrinibacteria bacterium]MDZ4245366.1 succinylglutamate desuccinylase/aspartoacylase family protein [Candidatus Gracilibacteria bacterium]